ncbi:MAG: HAD family hydrolase [Pseudomonadota bacterium]
MWSGPRNLSTAMMRSFSARADCAVWDEPFFAAYLAETGLDHPMRADILAAHDTDAARVAARCGGPAPRGAPLFYQKHMTHHMLPQFDRTFMDKVTSAFLIRDPHLVAASYEVKRDEPTLDDLGVPQQWALFEQVAQRLGKAPPVVDSADIAANPQRTLNALCDALGIPFDEAMLSWPQGLHPDDGVWAKHWYHAVIKSTGFAPPRAATPLMTDHAKRIAEAAWPVYEALRAHALTTPRDASQKEMTDGP